MKFRDRVANKPNRVRLTYEEGGTSVYATVELADEPIDEGTPLNALNMNKLLNKENTDYIIEQGTSGGFTWEKWKSGKAVCYSKITVSSEADPANVYSVQCNLPFEFADTDYYVFVTAYQDTGTGANMYQYYKPTTSSFWIGSDLPSKIANVKVVGKWK